MKTFWSVFFAILAAALVIGGVWTHISRKNAAEEKRIAEVQLKIAEARHAAIQTLDFIRETEARISEMPSESRVESFAKVFRLAANIVPNLPPDDRGKFIEAMNYHWNAAVQKIPEAMLRDFPKPLSESPLSSRL